jgi:hypothetical protein
VELRTKDRGYADVCKATRIFTISMVHLLAVLLNNDFYYFWPFHSGMPQLRPQRGILPANATAIRRRAHDHLLPMCKYVDMWLQLARRLVQDDLNLKNQSAICAFANIRRRTNLHQDASLIIPI